MSIFTKIFSWFKKAAVSVEHEAAKLGVLITEAFKSAATNGSLDVVGYIVDVLTKSGIGTSAVAKAKVIIPEAFSIFFGLEDPGTDAAAVTKWSEDVLKAIGVTSDRSKLFTELTIDLAKRIQAAEIAANGADLTFGQWAIIVEQTFQDYQTHEAEPIQS